jgi:hypothetical protein
MIGLACYQINKVEMAVIEYLLQVINSDVCF